MNARRQFLGSLVVFGLVAFGLLGYGAVRHYSTFSFLPWNLFLALLPLLFAARLHAVLRRKSWGSWECLAWSLLWILFLPNSFYLISDFIHLSDVAAAHLLYDVVLFTAYVLLGVIFGYSSLIVVHRDLRRRLGQQAAGWLVAVVLLGASFAIYIGRDLRWNSWDVLFSPGGVLFDVSDRFLAPRAYPGMFVTTFSFFALLGSLYLVLWSAVRLLARGR